MNTLHYANLPENKSGFWVEKLYSCSDKKCFYVVYHQGMREICDSINEAKQRLLDRFAFALITIEDLLNQYNCWQ